MKEDDKEYWQQLSKLYTESSTQFDKQLLYIASGAFGISFAFLKDIVKITDSVCKCYLIAAWSAFSLVILFSIISHFTSMKAINRRMKYLQNEKEDNSKVFNVITKTLNISMIILLAAGLIFLTVFVAINI